MMKNFLHHKEIREENRKPATRRIVSVLCITGAIAVAGLGTACTSNTADTTTTGTSVEAEAVTDTADNAAENTTAAETANTTTETTDTTGTDGTTANDTAAVTESTEISLADAKAIALADAGLAAADVTFTTEGQDTENGTAVYTLDFYTATTEYDYEIRISDGSILEKSTEAFIAGDSDTASTAGSYIGFDEAKSIALANAGFAETDVTLKKNILESDNGIMVYEVEFYHGTTEYEYTINAANGNIVEYSIGS